jgi:hypothetical protein
MNGKMSKKKYKKKHKLKRKERENLWDTTKNTNSYSFGKSKA